MFHSRNGRYLFSVSVSSVVIILGVRKTAFIGDINTKKPDGTFTVTIGLVMKYIFVADTPLTVCGLPESFLLLILNLAESAKKRLGTAGHLDCPFPF